MPGLGGGHGVRAWENVRWDLQDEVPALEKGQVGDGGGAEGQLLRDLICGKVGVGGRAEGQLLLGEGLEAAGKIPVVEVGARKGAPSNKIPSSSRVSTGISVQEIALQGLFWVQVDNMKEVQGFKRAKTSPLVENFCKPLTTLLTSLMASPPRLHCLNFITPNV